MSPWMLCRIKPEVAEANCKSQIQTGCYILSLQQDILRCQWSESQDHHDLEAYSTGSQYCFVVREWASVHNPAHSSLQRCDQPISWYPHCLENAAINHWYHKSNTANVIYYMLSLPRMAITDCWRGHLHGELWHLPFLLPPLWVRLLIGEKENCFKAMAA